VAGLTEFATHSTLSFYSLFCRKIYTASSSEVAELAKLLENTFRQVNIALINEVAEIANSIGISANEVVEAADTKPFGFMKFYPSLGVGGHCIPVDPVFLTSFAENLGVETELISTANNINLKRPEQIINHIEKFLGLSLSGLRIQIAGIAYKVGVSDIRESPALKLISLLSAKGAKVSWHDPLVKFYDNNESQPLDKTIDIGIIVAPHQEIDFGPWENLNHKIVNLSVGKNHLRWPKFL
jgi:UDP-N-acetyl-D-glucosamine dehydrogenase